MRFSCNRQALQDILVQLSGIVPSRSSKPILQNILLEGQEDGTIRLSATDLEIALRHTFHVEDLEDPESTLLPAGPLVGLIRGDWSETVQFTLKEHRLEIVSPVGRFTLQGAPAEGFPPFHTLEEEKSILLPGEDLVEAVEKTLFAAAKGDVRYALNGVLFHIEEDRIHFVASDTHRLSLLKKKLRAPVSQSTEAIVITKGMAELGRIAQEAESVRVQITPHEILAETPQACLMARLVDGQFPRYGDVIPKDLGHRVTVERELLNKSLRLVGLVADDERHDVTFSASDETLLLTTSGASASDGRVEIPAEVEGGEIGSSFNYLYVIDALKVFGENSVTFQFRDASTPVRLDEGDFTHIVMPIKALEPGG